MKLTELSAHWLRIIDDRRHKRDNRLTPSSADGVMFLCPKCFRANGGERGTHSVICWKPEVPAAREPGPGRWSFQGSSLEDLTLVASSSSIALLGGCRAHFFIQNGAIIDC